MKRLSVPATLNMYAGSAANLLEGCDGRIRDFAQRCLSLNHWRRAIGIFSTQSWGDRPQHGWQLVRSLRLWQTMRLLLTLPTTAGTTSARIFSAAMGHDAPLGIGDGAGIDKANAALNATANGVANGTAECVIVRGIAFHTITLRGIRVSILDGDCHHRSGIFGLNKRPHKPLPIAT